MPSYLEAVLSHKTTLNNLQFVTICYILNIQVSDKMTHQACTAVALIMVLAFEAGEITEGTSSARRHDRNCISSMSNVMFNQTSYITHTLL